jgi:hypothetical protein
VPEFGIVGGAEGAERRQCLVVDLPITAVDRVVGRQRVVAMLAQQMVHRRQEQARA